MITLKNILESKLKEQKPLGDIMRDSDTDDEHLNVLFIGDSELLQDWSFAKMLLRKKLVRGRIVANDDISAKQMLRLLRASLNPKYDIVTIMGAGNSDTDKDASRAIQALESMYKLAKRHDAKVIAISNPIKKYVDNFSDTYPSSIDISSWINDQGRVDDVIDISRFNKGFFDKSNKFLNIDGHREIASEWIDIVQQYQPTDSDEKDDSKDKDKKPGVIVPAIIPADIYDGDLVSAANFDASISAQATRMLARFEGFNAMAQWDVNNWRIGHGSSTITTPNGEIVRLGNDRNSRPLYVVTREDAARDLQRRLSTEFIPKVISSIGPMASQLPKGVVAALVSVAYNYGSLPSSIKAAARAGDIQQIADTIRARQIDNDGVNKSRRNKEANYVLAASKSLVKTESYIKLKSLIKK